MIPVGMRNKNVNIKRAFFKIIFHKIIAKDFYTGSQINDYEPFAGTYFQASGIAPEFYSIASGTGYGSPNSPKTYR
jgi:hypothetical protein